MFRARGQTAAKKTEKDKMQEFLELCDTTDVHNAIRAGVLLAIAVITFLVARH